MKNPGILVGLLVLTLWLQLQPTTAQEGTPAGTPAPASDGTLEIRFARGIDGDTLEAYGAGGRIGVGLIGVDAPSLGAPCGEQAAEALRQLLRGGIRLEPDASIVVDDRVRRMYYASTLSGESIQLALVRAGVVRADGQGKQAAELAAAEAAARAASVGCLWGGPATSSPGAAPSGDAAVEPAAAATVPPGFTDELVTSGISQGTAFVFLPDGRILIAQKAGAVRVFKNGALLPTPLLDISRYTSNVSARRVNDYWDRGLVGIEVDPNFAANGYIYLLYPYLIPGQPVEGPTVVRVSRFTVVGDTASPSSEVVIAGTVSTPCPYPATGTDCIPSFTGVHQGGNLRFAPDGSLYVITGDGAHYNTEERSLGAQNLDSLAGKVLRITATGDGLPSNPFWNGNPDAARSKVWAYGFRNPFRLNLRPGTSVPYIGDVGNSRWEEIDVGVAGNNYGWPCYEGPDQGASLFRTSSICEALYAAPSSVRSPLTAYAHGTSGASVTGGDFYTGTAYPAQYQGAYFFADYSRNWIRYVTVNGSNGLVSGPTDFAAGVTGPVDIEAGPDQNLYYLSFIYTSGAGELRRIRFTGLAATPTPTATPTPPGPTAAYRDTVLADSPVSYWRLGETSGSIATDERGANGGAYAGSPTLGAAGALAGDTNKAVTLNGSSQYVNVADAASLSPQAGANGKLSLEAWVKVTSLPASGPGVVISKGAGSGYEYALRVHSDGMAELVLWSPDGTTYQNVPTLPGLIAPGTWYHLVGTCDNGVACRVYVNGTERGSRTSGWGPILPGGTTAALAIGRRGDNVQYLAATIDEVAVYNTVLSATRVQAHFAAGQASGGDNQRPTATITSPTSTFRYQDGATIAFSGSATDAEDGALSGASLNWQVILHHCPGGVCHAHPLTSAVGSSGSFVDPIHGENTHFEIVLTATDSGGLQDTKSVSIFPAASAYRDAVLEDSPVAYWRLGDSGGTAARDHMGLHGGTYVGGPTLGVAGALSGDTDTAAGFSGSGQYVNVPDGAALSTQAGASGKLSLEAWVRLASLPTSGPGTVASKGSGSGYEYSLRVLPDGAVQFILWAPDGTTYQHVASPDSAVAPGAWYHLVGTCDNGVACRVYVNGTERGVKTTGWGASLPGDTPSAFAIGRRSDNVQHLAATVDEVAVYPSVLSLTRIQAHYTAGTGSAPPPTPTNTPGTAPTATPTATATPPRTPTPSGTSYRTAVLADNPVAYWRVGESNGTTAADERGTRPGSYVGSPTLGAAGALTGDANTAVRLSGSGQYVNVPDAGALSPQAGATGKLSLEAWVKVTSLPTSGPGVVISKGAANSYEYALRVHSNGMAELVLWSPDGTTYQNVPTPEGLIVPGTWYHLVGTCDNGVACRVYVNGTQRASKTGGWGPILPGDTTAPLAIGRRSDNVQYLAATIDEVAVYNTVLSATRVQAHFAASSGVGASTACEPRPDVGVTVARGAAGELVVSVKANINSNTPQNELRRIAFGAAANADIQFASQRGSGGFEVSVPAGTREAVFTVRRVTPGQAVTVPLTVVDSCGSWPTLVGGGPNAF